MACNQCKFYSEFTEPRDLSIAGEKFAYAVCYGMCYKQNLFKGNFQGYPVYIPEGNCKDFIRKRGIKQKDVVIDGQFKLQLMEGGQHDQI